MTDLAKRIHEVRGVRGLSLRAAAQAAEISPAYLQKLERGGVQQPSPSVLHRLSQALGVPYSDLMELAGHVVPRRGSSNASVNVLAHALSAKELTADEVEQLAKYLAWLRHEQGRDG